MIAYASRALTESEREYCATEKECLAVVFGVEKFRCYFDGARFKVITHHHALLKLNQMRDTYGRLARWSMRLHEFDMVIGYRKGSLNVVPDAFSRAPLEVNVIGLTPDVCDGDRWYVGLRDRVTNEPDLFPDYTMLDGFLYRAIASPHGVRTNFSGWRVVVPRAKRADVFAPGAVFLAGNATRSVLIRSSVQRVCVTKIAQYLSTWIYGPSQECSLPVPVYCTRFVGTIAPL